MFSCRFCNDIRKNSNSLRNHERFCKQNPNKQFSPFASKEVQEKLKLQGPRNHYIKASKIGAPKPIISDSTKQKIIFALKNRSQETKDKTSKSLKKTINEKVANGTWHTSLAKHMHIDYNGVDLHGKWELAYAKYLDKNLIEWNRCKKSFPYIFEGVQRKYTPDFYLKANNTYVEIKGYITSKDIAKWNQFPDSLNLLILNETKLKLEGII